MRTSVVPSANRLNTACTRGPRSAAVNTKSVRAGGSDVVPRRREGTLVASGERGSRSRERVPTLAAAHNGLERLPQACEGDAHGEDLDRVATHVHHECHHPHVLGRRLRHLPHFLHARRVQNPLSTLPSKGTSWARQRTGHTASTTHLLFEREIYLPLFPTRPRLRLHRQSGDLGFPGRWAGVWAESSLHS